ncbi:ATP-binding protein [Ascidiimonas aurantiaca]|uniref:ATP-binding protein n=1 Tax=Ascidiimonas aurantiaca TaxID=1685432 RepID=UPI0030EB9CA9
MSVQKIVITGGPGTGKTSIINTLQVRGYNCFPEISRQVTLKAREQGIEQLFLSRPLLFSERLLEGRKKQFQEALEHANPYVFLDRGIPDILAYMDYIGDEYPSLFQEACETHRYDKVFLLPPWKAIYKSDNERYESFEQSEKIYKCLKKTYIKHKYDLIEVPTGAVDKRTDFIISMLET